MPDAQRNTPSRRPRRPRSIEEKPQAQKAEASITGSTKTQKSNGKENQMQNHIDRTVHIVVQGKGGCGKSTTASHQAQALQAMTGAQVMCINTDPVNNSLGQYSALYLRDLEIMESDNQINPRRFDTMIDWILEHPGPVVIDNGASSFIPINSYMAETGAIEALEDEGRQVFIHTILVGGKDMKDTLAGLNALLETTSAPIIVWENEHFGPVERDGKRLAESETFQEWRHRFAGIVTLPPNRDQMLGTDYAMMASAGLTYAEAFSSNIFGTMPRRRLQKAWNNIFGQIAAIHGGLSA